jgi:hypothetical protein
MRRLLPGSPRRRRRIHHAIAQKLTDGEPSYSSGAPVPADGNLLTFDDNGDLPQAFGISEHLIKLVFIRFNINEFGIVAIRRPGSISEWSAMLSVDENLFRHSRILLLLFNLGVRSAEPVSAASCDMLQDANS